MSCSAAGVGSASATLIGYKAISGSISATSAATGTLGGSGALSGTLVGLAEVTALLLGAGALFGSSSGTSGSRADLDDESNPSKSIRNVTFNSSPFAEAEFTSTQLWKIQA
jgi:hypothetical protein